MINNSPKKLMNKNFGVYISKTVGGRKLDKHMQENFDLVDHRDYEYVINQKLNGKYVGVLFLMSPQGIGRWESGLGMKGFSRTSVGELKRKKYELCEHV